MVFKSVEATESILFVKLTRVSNFLWFDRASSESRPLVIERAVSKSSLYQITDDWKLQNKVETLATLYFDSDTRVCTFRYGVSF